MDNIGNIQIIIRLVLSIILSSLIGLERELRHKAAGLRTHVLVGLSSCLLMLVSIYVAKGPEGEFLFDPGRIAVGVVTGIGFLGAGTIIRFGVSVKGLTTAASLWAVAALGLAIGCGFYVGGCATAALIVISLLMLSHFEKNVSKTKIK